MILWLDDIREPPISCYIDEQGIRHQYVWVHSIKEAIHEIESNENLQCYDEYMGPTIYGIDLDHDLGDYAKDGGDGIKLLDWLEERGLFYHIGLHTMNPVGRENMNRVIEKNNWDRL